MSLSKGDRVVIGVNGYDWDIRDPFVFEGAVATVEKIYNDVDPVIYDVTLEDRDLHKGLGGADDQTSWPFYEHELSHVA